MILLRTTKYTHECIELRYSSVVMMTQIFVLLRQYYFSLEKNQLQSIKKKRERKRKMALKIIRAIKIGHFVRRIH